MQIIREFLLPIVPNVHAVITSYYMDPSIRMHVWQRNVYKCEANYKFVSIFMFLPLHIMFQWMTLIARKVLIGRLNDKVNLKNFEKPNFFSYKEKRMGNVIRIRNRQEQSMSDQQWEDFKKKLQRRDEDGKLHANVNSSPPKDPRGPPPSCAQILQ